MQKHILIVASTFPSSDNDSVPAFVKDQAVAIKKAYPKVKISVLAPHDKRSETKPFTKHKAYDEYRFHYFWPFNFERLAGRGIMPALRQNPINYLLIPFLFVGEFVSLLKLAIKLQPDFIYAHWFTPQAVAASWVSSITKVPFVYTTHASDVSVWQKIPFVGKKIVIAVSKKSRAITAVSQRSMAKLQQFFSDDQWENIKAKTSIIPMGVELDQFAKHKKSPAALKKQYDLEGKQIILFVGRLAEKKGVSYLLKSFAKIQQNHPDSRLVIAGDGPLKKSLEHEAKNLGINKVTIFTGYIAGQEKNDYFHMCDLLVLPSIITDDGDAEGLPVVMMEGLAAGKICVATNESGADNIIADKDSGFLIQQKSVNQLSAAIDSALTLSLQEQKKMSQSAIATSKQFDWESVAKEHIEFFAKNL